MGNNDNSTYFPGDPHTNTPPHQGRNRVIRIYQLHYGFGITRWLTSIVILVFCALRISDETKKEDGLYGLLLAALIINTVSAGLHCLLPGPPTRQRSQTNQRPPRYSIAVIACSCVLWTPAFCLFFVAYGDTDGPHDELFDIFKRKVGRGGRLGATSSFGNVDIDLLIGILGVLAFGCGFFQGICELLLYLKRFTPLEVKASYERSIRRYWYLKNLYN